MRGEIDENNINGKGTKEHNSFRDSAHARVIPSEQEHNNRKKRGRYTDKGRIGRIKRGGVKIGEKKNVCSVS